MPIPKHFRKHRNGSWAKGHPFRKIISFDDFDARTMKIVAKLECGHKAIAGYGSKKARCLDCPKATEKGSQK